MWVLLWIGTMTSAFLKEIEIMQLMQFYVPLYECLFFCNFFFFQKVFSNRKKISVLSTEVVIGRMLVVGIW